MNQFDVATEKHVRTIGCCLPTIRSADLPRQRLSVYSLLLAAAGGTELIHPVRRARRRSDAFDCAGGEPRTPSIVRGFIDAADMVADRTARQSNRRRLQCQTGNSEHTYSNGRHGEQRL